MGMCATAAEVSLIGLIVGSITLSLQYLQILYLLVAIPIVCNRIADASGSSRRSLGR
jgi:hypothetical protein